MKKIIITIFVIITISCQNKPNTNIYKNFYNKELKTGVIANKELYLVIPIDICPTCIKSIIQYLNLNSFKNTSIVFVGKTYKDINLFADLLSNDYKIIKIKDIEYFSQFQNVFIITKNNKKIKYLNFPDNNFYQITRTINEF